MPVLKVIVNGLEKLVKFSDDMPLDRIRFELQKKYSDPDVVKAINALRSERQAMEISGKVGYNTPIISQRKFADDYPKYRDGDLPYNDGTTGKQGSRLDETIDGDRVTSRLLVGRTHVGEGDRGLHQTESDRWAREVGAEFKMGAKSGKDLKGDHGRLTLSRDVVSKDVIINNKAYPINIHFNKALNAKDADIVKMHEASHLIDEISGQIPTTGVKKDLESLYNVLNNKLARKGMKRKHYVLPTYDKDRELMAEAIRAYIVNPNYIKTSYPKVAKTIRKAVNNNPRINKAIQFNSKLAPTVGAGLLANEAYDGDSQAADMTHSSPSNLNAPREALQSALSTIGTGLGYVGDGIDYVNNVAKFILPKDTFNALSTEYWQDLVRRGGHAINPYDEFSKNYNAQSNRTDTVADLAAANPLTWTQGIKTDSDPDFGNTVNMIGGIAYDKAMDWVDEIKTRYIAN